MGVILSMYRSCFEISSSGFPGLNVLFIMRNEGFIVISTGLYNNITIVVLSWCDCVHLLQFPIYSVHLYDLNSRVGGFSCNVSIRTCYIFFVCNFVF